MAKRLQGQTNTIGADFLQVDSAIALTFSSIASQTSDPESKRSTIRTARRAYDSIMWLRKKIDLSEAQRENLDANLQRLKTELQRLGERF